jgi:hypothetical protein
MFYSLDEVMDKMLRILPANGKDGDINVDIADVEAIVRMTA